MNIFAFLQSKLQQKPQVVTQQQAKAAMGSKEQAEMLSKFGVVTDDLRMALQANDLINFERCLAGDTRIKLLDNTTPTIREMAEHPELYIGRYVASINPTSLDLEPDKIVGVKQTVKNAELVRVTLDDDHYVDCTLSHRFLLRDGTYKEAQYLQPLDSLMPFYVRFTEGKNPLHQYLQAYRPGLNRWIYLHRLVPAFFGAILGKGITVHHKNFKKEDNDPSNLQVMTTPEHRALHALLARKRPEGIKVCPICKEEFVTTLYLESPELEFNYCGRKCWAKSKEKDLVTLICEVCERPFETTCSAASYRKTCSVKCASVAKSTDETLRAIEEKPFTTCPICKKEFPTTAQLLTYCSQKCYWESKKGKAPWNKGLKAESDERVARDRDCSLATKVRRREEARVLLNHKVLKVERLSQREDTYDLQTERNHNFPLAIGVFVHNSSLYTSIDKSLIHPLMASAPSLFAEVATAYNRIQNATVWVTAKSKEYQYQIEKLLEIINIEEEIYDLAWSTATFGDLFWNVLAEPGLGVVSINSDAHPINYCLRGDTKIRLFDDSTPTIKEMFDDREKYIGNDIYCCSESGGIRATQVKDVLKTRLNATYVRVHLDSGEFFDVTPDHKCMLRTGKFKEARDLQPFESLMPLYSKADINGEQLIYSPKTNKWTYVKQYGYIYKTTNLVNGKIYIGQRVGEFEPTYYGSGIVILRALEKYGVGNFKVEVLAYGSSREQLNALEVGFIKNYREALGIDSLYNIREGGQGYHGANKEETKQKIRLANLNASPEAIENRRLGNLAKRGRKWIYNSLTDEHKLVWPKEIEGFLEQEGWKLGHGNQSLEQREKNHIANSNTIWVNNPLTNEEFRVKQDKAREYLGKGFLLGRSKLMSTEEKRASRALNGLKGAAVVRNTTWIHRGEKRKRVQSAGLDNYLADGWEIGHALITVDSRSDYFKRTGRHGSSFGKKGSATGKKWVRREAKELLVLKEKVDQYLRDGWVLGRNPSPFKGKSRKNIGVLLNHKVVRVEYLDIVEDAYDLTVMGVNPTFPLACGVFVHNSRVDYNGRCLKGDTKIELLDNTAPTIQEMAESPEKYIGKYVLSINPNTLTLEPDKIVNIFKTKRDAKLMRITLDNGEFVDCTADHRFLLRDGTYKEAKDLVEGQSLMPYYTKISTDPNFEGYKLAYNPKTQTYRHVHQLVSYFINGKTPKGFVIHHRLVEGGPNKLNNDPAFLQVITKQEHSRLHQEYRSLTHKEDCGCVFCKQERGECKGENSYLYGTKQSEEHILNRILSRQSHPLDCTCGSCVFNHSEDCTCLTCCSKRGERFGHKEGCMCYNCVYLRNGGQEVTRVCEYCHTSFTCRNTQPQFLCSDACQDAWQKGRKYIFNPITGEILYIVGEQLDRYVREGWKLGRGKTTTMRGRKWILNRSLNKSIRVSNEQVPEYLEQGWEYGRLAPWLKPQVINHKVFKIEYLTEVADVYDLTTERNHNFPLKAGVFVHNCIGFYSTPGGYNTSAERNLLPPWDLVHFRLLGAKRRRPQYGGADSNYCITGDTRIHLLDGTSPTVKEMSEGGYVGKAIWSVNLETGRQEEDEIVEVKKTRLNAELVRVTLSNGKFIECTPDHKFLLRSKIYVEAQNLTEGEQLRAYDSKGNSWVAFRSSVRKVEKLEKREDTYDLEIKKNHNFPTAAGVFISNSEFRTVSIMAPDVRRLTSKYGTSVLSDALPIFKRLRLAEDSILMARITRGVLRNVWKIGISKENGNNEAVNSIIDGYISTLKEARSLSIDVNNPSYNSKFNAMANIEDIIIPVWGEVNQVMVDKIGGEVDIKWLEDVDLLTKQLSTALAVPLPLLAGYAEAANGGIGQNSLEKLDIRFARQARRIQRAVIVGLTRLAQIHLAWQGINPDTKLFQIHMSETSTAEELEIQDALDKGLDVTGKMLEMLEAVLGPDLDKEAALEYLSEKFLKLGDLELDKLKLKGNPNAFNVPKGEDTLGGGLGAAPASDSSSNPFLSHAPSGESTGGETPAPSTAPEGESEVKEEPAEEEKNPFKENLSISDLRSMVPLKESRDKWDAQWGHIRVKIIKKD